MNPLENIHVLSLAVNLPGPLAVARLQRLGAAVVKVEPPDGDALARACPDWYRELHEGQQVIRLDLKDAAERAQLDGFLARADLLITATRPAALQRLGLAWPDLHSAYPRLCQVAIGGYPSPDEDRPGHDLTYQAGLGLLSPPDLARVCVADLAGAEEAVSAALVLLLARERGQGAGCVQVSLAAAAERFAEPLRRGLTAPGGPLGGGLPGYNLYRAREGWVAVAALEPHFLRRLQNELGLTSTTREALESAFRTRTAREWEAWAVQHNLPVAAVQEVAAAVKER